MGVGTRGFILHRRQGHALRAPLPWFLLGNATGLTSQSGVTKFTIICKWIFAKHDCPLTVYSHEYWPQHVWRAAIRSWHVRDKDAFIHHSLHTSLSFWLMICCTSESVKVARRPRPVQIRINIALSDGAPLVVYVELLVHSKTTLTPHVVRCWAAPSAMCDRPRDERRVTWPASPKVDNIYLMSRDHSARGDGRERLIYSLLQTRRAFWGTWRYGRLITRRTRTAMDNSGCPNVVWTSLNYWITLIHRRAVAMTIIQNNNM